MDKDIIDELDDYYVNISIDEDILIDDVDDDFIIDDGIDIDINYDVIDDYVIDDINDYVACIIGQHGW